jgi:1-deoxy-D-xylulose-5-phosphate synthase
MGVPDRIVEHGTQRELHDEVGIGPDGIVAQVKELAETPVASS